MEQTRDEMLGEMQYAVQFLTSPFGRWATIAVFSTAGSADRFIDNQRPTSATQYRITPIPSADIPDPTPPQPAVELMHGMPDGVYMLLSNVDRVYAFTIGDGLTHRVCIASPRHVSNANFYTIEAAQAYADELAALVNAARVAAKGGA